jgi:hypothetical protein
MGITNPLPFRGPYFEEYPLTLDGTSQVLIPDDMALRYLLVQNPTGNGDIKINVLGGDALLTGLIVPGGGSLELAQGVSNGQVTVSGVLGEDIYAIASNY